MNTSSAAVVARPRLSFDVEKRTDAVGYDGARKVALISRGRRHGPVTRLVSPSDIGEPYEQRRAR